MPSRRYTIVLTDCRTGATRGVTISARPVIAVACAVATLPVLVGVGAAWKAKADVASVYANRQALEQENASYRAATADLTGQIDALQSAIKDISALSALDPNVFRAMQKLPAFVKARAMGGGMASEGTARPREEYSKAISALAGPDDTFGLLRNLLESLESRLLAVRNSVEKRNALAAATPSIWPATGWLTSGMGDRQDPITGEADFHPGLDIAGDRGQPVYATAEGVVSESAWENGYGNVITIDHGFGLQTRYGHLLKSEVKPGAKVKRGDLIGRVGNTGRSTGYHLHYEVRANGKLVNPLQLLTQQRPRDQ
jgi:murein DD-endopeptidase MepM/ murein hydrolase activator NlpD